MIQPIKTRLRFFLRTATVAAMLFAFTMHGRSTYAELPRLSVSADGRMLMKGDKPFFWMADTAWRIHRLSLAEMDAYLSDRRAKGFNVIQGPNLHSSHLNYFGENNPDHTSPNEAWFAYFDQVVERCAAHNLYIAPVLTWGNFATQFTVESAFAHGLYIGQRYRTQSNIAAFIVCGEFNHPSPNVAIWNALAAGVQSGLDGVPVMMTALPRWYGWFGGQSSSYDLHAQPWLSLNLHQSSLYGDCSNNPTNLYHMGTHNWLLAQHDWPMLPAKPFIDAEAVYEDQSPLNPACEFNPNRWPAFGVRRRAYWSVFAGAAGHTYGANGVFQFYRPGETSVDWSPNEYWTAAINFPGAHQMTHLHRLMRSRPMFNRIPAQDLILAGATELVPLHVHATRAADGSFAMVYVPECGKSITIDMDSLTGDGHRTWWFDPMTGHVSMFGDFVRRHYTKDGGLTLTTPSVGEDWVLVVDDLAANFGAPGFADLRKPGDVTGDEHVNVSDLLAVISAWGACSPAPAPCIADVDPLPAGDAVVNVSDLLAVIGNWGA